VPDATPPPPSTRRAPHVDVLHGFEVADPYRWLEEPTSDDVRAWVREQNAVSGAHIASLPHRELFRERLLRLWDHPRRSAPWRRGEHWFELRNDGLQDQDVLWTASAETGGSAAAPPTTPGGCSSTPTPGATTAPPP
jgi:prolyl oligopeptidase